MLKIEDLKVRDTLVHIETGVEYEVQMFLSDNEILLVGGEIANDLAYFKKKEQSQNTFDDLIDVAVQAYKDGILSGLSLDNVGTRKVSCWSEGFSDHAFDQLNDYKRIIDSINALYSETFTIDQSNDNLQRVKVGATIKNHPSGSPFVLENQDAIDDLYDAPYWLTNGLIVEQSRND